MFFKVPDTIREAGCIQRKSLFKNILSFLGVVIVADCIQFGIVSLVTVIMLLIQKKSIDISVLLNMETQDEATMILTLFSTITIIAYIIYYCLKVEKRPITSMGFRKKGMLKEYGKGLIIGFILISLVVGIEILTGSLKITGWGNLSFVSILMIIVFLIGFIIQSAEEEIMMRGYFLTTLGVNNSIPIAIFVSSVAFSLLHIFNDGFDIISFVNITLVGIFLALYYVQTNNIWGVSAIHGIWNFAQGNFYGIQVSGMNINRSILASQQIEGKELLNGGIFGAENGLVSTIVYVLAIIILLVYMYKKGTIMKKVKESTAS